MTLEQKVLNGVNQIKDNLWLGDIKKTKEIIDNILSDEKFIRKYLNSFQEVYSLFEEVKKEVIKQYKKESFEYKLFLSKRFKERIREPFKYEESIIGLLIFEIKRLRYKLEKIEPLLKESRLIQEIIQKPSYRYTIFEYPPKYEIRVLIDKKVEANVNKLIKKLEEKGFKCSKFGEKHYVFITAYSTQSYIEIAILFPKVSISISLLTPKKEEAQKLVEMIIDSLIS
jgi:hypothetical protein